MENSITSIKKLLRQHDKGWDRYRKKHPKRNWINAELEKEFGIPHVTNKQRSLMETHNFKKGKPDNYVAYVGDNAITTWTGQKLGDILWKGGKYRGGFGGERQNIKVRAITGDIYSGTHYVSSGDYARLKKLKNKIRKKK